jgi:glutaredoxin
MVSMGMRHFLQEPQGCQRLGCSPLAKEGQLGLLAGMPQPLPIFYTKPGCPWCTEALAFFETQGVKLDVRDVSADMHQMRQLIALTGQSKCPSFRYGDFIVADFGVDEFINKARKHPAVCAELGLKV